MRKILDKNCIGFDHVGQTSLIWSAASCIIYITSFATGTFARIASESISLAFSFGKGIVKKFLKQAQ